MSTLSLIADSEFLRAIPDDSMARLEQLAQVRSYSPGVVLFAEGARHDDFHVISTGNVRLDMQVQGRGRIPILTAGPGDVLAWSALLGNGIMTASAVALEAVQTVAFPGPALRELAQSQPELGYRLMQQLATALSRRLLATRLQLLDLFANHVPALTPAVGRLGDPEC